MNYDLLLDWVSERGHGTWGQFRDVHDWLARDAAGYRPRASTTALVMSSLGHLEMDWRGARWTVCSPALTILPAAGGHAVIVGSRTRTMKAAILATAEPRDDIFIHESRQDGAPSVLYVAAEDEAGVKAFARELNINYEACVAERLAELLPSLDDYLAAAPISVPARGFGVRRFRSTDGSLRWQEVTSDTEPGLYEYEAWNRPEYRFGWEGRPRDVDKFIGTYAELRRFGVSVLRFEHDTVNGSLLVNIDSPLPTLHARAAVMCSGRAPEVASDRRLFRYVNVSHAVAARIARCLGQELREINSAPDSGPAAPRRIGFLKLAPKQSRPSRRGRPRV